MIRRYTRKVSRMVRWTAFFNRRVFMNRNNLRFLLVSVMAIALAALIVVRFDDVCSVAGSVWQAIEPLAVGAVIAYLLNFIAVRIEGIWFPASDNKFVNVSRRPICVILAIAIATLAVVALGMFVANEFKSVGSAIASGLLNAAVATSQAISTLPGAEEFPVVDANAWDSAAQKAVEALGGGTATLSLLACMGGEVAHTVLSVFLGMVFALYLLLDKDRVHAGALRALTIIPGSHRRDIVMHFCTVANDCFSRFIMGQCIEACILGVLCGIGSAILHFPYAASIGLIVGVTSVIPFAGAWIGGIVGAAMILSQDPLQAVQFVIFLVILQQIEGHLIYPNVVGQSVGLPSIWVFVAVVVGATLFGLPGVLLGVPVISTVRTLVMEKFAKEEARGEAEALTKYTG